MKHNNWVHTYHVGVLRLSLMTAQPQHHSAKPKDSRAKQAQLSNY